MTFPIDLHLGLITIPSHFVFDLLAFYLAVNYYSYLNQNKTDHLSEKSRWLVISGGAIGALIGSRLLAALERPELFLHPPSWLFYYENKTIVGGLVGAILGVEIIKKLTGELKRSGDFFTYPFILGIIVGRIGCFLTGVKDDTVGLPSTLPWAFDQGDGIPRHPTALYEILFAGLLWLGLKTLTKKVTLPEGALFRLFVVAYLLFRFLIEFIKPIRPLAFGLSAIQLTALLVSFYYIITLTISYFRRPTLKIAVD